jgi:hypothetical protein
MRTAPALVLGTLLTAGALASAQAFDGSRNTPSAVRLEGAVAEATASAFAARYRDITIPAGTVLPVTLDSYVASDSSRIEDPVRAHVRRDVVVQGVTVIPAGSALSGYVTSVQRPGRVKGRGYIAFRFNRLSVAGSSERLTLRTSAVARRAPATKGEDATKIGLPAAGGAIVGAIAGGKKGAAIGAAAGGGAGTAVVLSTRGREVRLGRGLATSVRLLEPATLRVRR